jgi:hypothetical protein
MTSDKIEMASKELFETRGISFNSPDFSYFMNEVLFDPDTGKSSTEILSLVKDITGGKILDQDYLNLSYKTQISLNDIINPKLTNYNLTKLLNYVPTSFSKNSVGKGEYGFILLTEGSKKAKNSGDMQLSNGEDIEVKANGAKMASQSSHIPLSSIKKDCIEWIKNRTGKEFKEIFNLTGININNFYFVEVFENRWSDLIDFLKFVFSKTMINLDEGEIDWINMSLIDQNGHFDYFIFLEKLALFEFTYYKKCDKFDKILFVNVNDHCPSILNTDSVDHSLLKNFKLTRSFSFKGERVQTNYWSLK